MGRGASARLCGAHSTRWRAVRDGCGRWRVVDQQGREPLRDPDPLGQVLAVHLAASAPAIRDALAILAQRLKALESPYTRDADRLRLAELELSCSRPDAAELMPLVSQRVRQLELDPDGR